MTYSYSRFVCEHCKRKVKRRKPLTYQFSRSCPYCHKRSSYYVDDDGNEHPRPPPKSEQEIMEELARLGALKPEVAAQYGYWQWKSKRGGA